MRHLSRLAILALLGLAASPAAAAPMSYTLAFSGTGFNAYPTYVMSGSMSFLFDRDAPPGTTTTLTLTDVSLNIFGIEYTTANTTLTYFTSVGGRLLLTGNTNGLNMATNTNDMSVEFRNFLTAPAGDYAPYSLGFARASLFGIQFTPQGQTAGTLSSGPPGGLGEADPVPEPAMPALFGLGAAGLMAARRRRR